MLNTDKFTDALSDAPTNADRVGVSGHTGGYITKWALGEYADIIPVSIGGSATTYMCDHYWVDYDNTQNTLLVGGRASHGSRAGLAGFNASVSGLVNANVGLRYFFFVFFLNFICDICSLPLGKR